MWFIYWLVFYLTILCFHYYILRDQAGKWRLALFLLAVAAILPLPLLAPTDLLPVRFILAVASFGTIIKAAEIAYGKVCDPKMLDSFGRYVIWSFNIPDTFWTETPEAKRVARSEGRIRIGRGVLKTSLFLGLLAISTYQPEMHAYYWLKMFWFLWCCYFAASGFGDIATGSIMQLGLQVSPIFNNPFMARSPRDFWSRRWNLCFRDIAHRDIFLPLQGNQRPVLATFMVFLMSGVIHEYLVLASAGIAWLGGMTAFFMLQWVATIAQTILAKKLGKKQIMPQAVAVICHFLWLLLTIPLFATPFLQVLAVHTWRLWC